MNARGTKHEARLFVMVLMAVCSAVALAMPTQQELKKAQPLVAELMAPIMDDFKAKKKTAAEVADAAVKYAAAAETEAAKFMLYRSSIPYYVRGEAYDKAAEAVELMKANVKDVPAEVIAEIISKASVRATAKKAPRLFELYRQAKAQVVAEKDIKELRKKPATATNKRKLAEALATAGNWQEALKEFAGLTDQTAQMAKKEQDGSGKSYELGEFWWAYKPTYETAEDIFKIHAAFYYRKALAAGEITGLKKNIIERRVKEYEGRAEVAVAKLTEPKQLTYSGYITKINTLLWEGVSVNDIQSFTATMAGGHVSHSGKTIGYVVDSGDGWKSVQFQLVDGENGQNFLKCVYARFEQRGNEVRGYVEKAAVAETSVAIGTDLRTVGSAKEYYLSFKDDGDGYGIKDLVVTIGGKSAASALATTSPNDSIELKTGGDSPFTVKGNEATLELNNGANLEFVKCPSGWVKIVDDYEKLTLRKVRITRPFWIMKQGLKTSDLTGRAIASTGWAAHVFHEPDPAAVDDFCAELTGELKAVIPAGYVVRPPSLAEWEYAYHAGDEDPGSEPFGSLLAYHDYTVFDTHKGTSPVNKWGLHDFHVYEKVYDRIDPKDVKTLGKENIAKLPRGLSSEDLFFWNNELDSASYLMRSPNLRALMLNPKKSPTGFIRLVIGPDLVSEWKAKHGGKK